MKSTTPHPGMPSIVALALLACATGGCTQTEAAQEPAVRDVSTAASSAQGYAVAGDACGLLRDAEVRQVFAGAGSAERNDAVEAGGIAQCGWKSPTGRIDVQWTHGTDQKVRDWMETVVEVATNGERTAEQAGIRLEPVRGIGDEAMVMIERVDAARGIVHPRAVLGLRRGEQVVLLMSEELAERDRADALAALTRLGRAAAGRL